jgi:hypothetical protein
MAKVIYTPSDEDGCPSSTTAFGFSFKANKATEVPEGLALQKFRGHRHFEVIEEGAPKRGKAKADEPEAETAADEPEAA